MKLVIDSNIFVSGLDPKDKFHNQCAPIIERLINFEIEALCPTLVLVETTCAIRRRTNSESLALLVYRTLLSLPSAQRASSKRYPCI